MDKKDLLRRIPAVNLILQQEQAQKMIAQYGHSLVAEAAADVTEDLRRDIFEAGNGCQGAGKEVSFDLSLEKVAFLVGKKVRQKTAPNLQRVINATGIILHTNLGRSLLSQAAIEAVNGTAGHYTNLELELAIGERGSRYVHVVDLLRRLTGAEDAVVVNNNAAAVLLVLNTLAKGREVIVSRGQLVEIGGSFRIPDVMAQSGARLVEVGTTNKTHLRDYENAVSEETALLLKVHTSNYKVVGFTSSVSSEELVRLGKELHVPVVEDLGSGVLVDLQRFGLPEEPRVQDSVKEGLDIVTFSGDKLLGGPQAGLIVGRAEYIEKIKKNPLTRALRIDKFTVAALEATLRLYLDEEKAFREIPTLRMITMSREELKKKATRLKKGLAGVLDGLSKGSLITVEEGFSQVGGGAYPDADLPTYLVALEPKDISVNALEEKLRLGRPAVLARISKDRLLFDPRTIADEEFGLVCARVAEALGE